MPTIKDVFISIHHFKGIAKGLNKAEMGFYSVELTAPETALVQTDELQPSRAVHSFALSSDVPDVPAKPSSGCPGLAKPQTLNETLSQTHTTSVHTLTHTHTHTPRE